MPASRWSVTVEVLSQEPPIRVDALLQGTSHEGAISDLRQENQTHERVHASSEGLTSTDLPDAPSGKAADSTAGKDAKNIDHERIVHDVKSLSIYILHNNSYN